MSDHDEATEQPTAPQPEPVAVAADERDEKIAAMLRAWMVDCIHGSPVARDVEALNHITASLPELGRRIKETV